jgi:DNA-binding Lrp family transcriptional regulator
MTTEPPSDDIPPPPPEDNAPQPRNNGNHMFMTPRGQRARDAWAAERWARDGWFYRQIAEAMGISVATAWDRVQRGLRIIDSVTYETAERARAAHRARLHAASEVVMEVMARDHVHVAHGKVVTDDAGTVILDDGPKLAAAGKVKELSESLRKLDGLDAPTQVNLGGDVTYQIVGVDPDALS